MSMKIVVPDDFPVVLTGSPAERRLRTLGDVTVYTEPGAEQETELVRRIGDADIVVNLRAYTRFSESALTACPSLRMISIWAQERTTLIWPRATGEASRLRTRQG